MSNLQLASTTYKFSDAGNQLIDLLLRLEWQYPKHNFGFLMSVYWPNHNVYNFQHELWFNTEPISETLIYNRLVNHNDTVAKVYFDYNENKKRTWLKEYFGSELLNVCTLNLPEFLQWLSNGYYLPQDKNNRIVAHFTGKLARLMNEHQSWQIQTFYNRQFSLDMAVDYMRDFGCRDAGLLNNVLTYAKQLHTIAINYYPSYVTKFEEILNEFDSGN